MKIQFWPRDDAANLFPPVPAKKCMPSWFKESGVAVPGHKHKITAADMMHDPSVQLSTIKKCPPATDFMTSGYIIRNFIDIMMTQKWNEDTKTEEVACYHNTRIGKPWIERHRYGQFPGVHPKKEVMKITGAWHIKTPPGYSCLIYQPFYLMEKRWQFLPAIVDTDTYTNPISFPFILPDSKEEAKEIYMDAGTPLVCIMPFKRDDWEMEITQEPKEDYVTRVMRTAWHDIYKRFFHKKKVFK